MNLRNVALVLLPILVSASIGSDIGGALDKILTVCLAVVALIVIMVLLFFLYWLFGRGGGGRG